jgi:hypothetical protein
MSKRFFNFFIWLLMNLFSFVRLIINMNESEELDLYSSDEEGSLASDSSQSQEDEDANGGEFSRTFENKQLATLRKLKSSIKYNKSLRRRLFIVEQELNRCHQAKLIELENASSNYENSVKFKIENKEKTTKNKNILPAHEETISISDIVDIYEQKTNSQYCQTEDDLEESSDIDESTFFFITLQN